MQVHKNIPMPAGTCNTKYPFGEMEINDSVFVPDDGTFEKARRAAQQYGKQKGWKFSARKHIGIDEVDGDEITVLVEAGGTIWRIE